MGRRSENERGSDGILLQLLGDWGYVGIWYCEEFHEMVKIYT